MNNIKKLADRIEAENELFAAMSPAQKRVVVAKDLIERIQVCNILPATGYIIEGRVWGSETDLEQDSELELNLEESKVESFKDILNKESKLPVCQVCAKGGLLAAFVGRVNNYESSTAGHEGRVHKKLGEIFSYRQLSLIEMSFEGRKYLHSDEQYTPIQFSERNEARAKSFYKKYSSSRERLLAIANNIIRNKGTFKL